MNISSGSVFGPLQPQHATNFEPLDINNFGFQNNADSGGTQAINFGNDAMTGTDFNSLTATPDSESNMDQMQGLAQMLGPQIQMLMLAMSILQQLFSSLQQGNNSEGTEAGNGSGGDAGMPDASAGEGEPFSAPVNAAVSQPATAPENSDTPQPAAATANPTPQPATASTNTPAQPGATTNAALNTPTQDSVSSSGGVPVTKGESGMYLPEPLKKYEKDIMHAARETNQPPEVLAGQIWQESRGKADAVTVNGGNGLSDSGVMQVNSNTFAELQSKYPHLLGSGASPSNSADSIMAGALYLKEQRQAFGGDLGAGLRAYNSGPGNVNVNDLTDISKTGTGDATYVGKVLNFADIFSTGKGTLPA